MKEYNSFDLITDLYFVRVGGTEEELRAAKIIEEKVRSYGDYNVEIENFPVDGCNIKNASLTIDGGKTYIDCVGVGMSGSTPIGGLTAPLEFVQSKEDALIKDIKGKIIVAPTKRIRNNIYKILVERGAVGLILCAGTVYKKDDEVDIDPYYLREPNYSIGALPGVCIRMRDMEKLLEKEPASATIVVEQEQFKKPSYNVVATIDGENADEIIAFTAHFDSVAFSRGAYDNASGSAGILELFKRFSVAKPNRTLKFIWCGSEESGLLGSKAYVRDHADEMHKYMLDINVDMIGATIGKEIAVATTEHAFVDYIRYESRIAGFPVSAKQGVYSSDSTPFADGGVPSVSFARISPENGATIHSRDDVIERLSEANYNRTCDFLYAFSEKLVNAKTFPVKREIPENMKLEIDYYYTRKEKPED